MEGTKDRILTMEELNLKLFFLNLSVMFCVNVEMYCLCVSRFFFVFS